MGDRPSTNKMFRGLNDQEKMLIKVSIHDTWCIDDPIRLQADYNKPLGEVFIANLNTTVGISHKSEAEIRQFLKNKYMMFIVSKPKFRSDLFGEEAIEWTSKGY